MDDQFSNPLYGNFLEFYAKEVSRTLSKLDHQSLKKAATLLVKAREERGVVHCFGNGGSASIAAHFSHNLNWDVSANLPDKQKFKAMSLNEQTCHLTGIANDRHFDQAFVAQLRNFLEPNDLVFGISASGQSENVVEAVEYAHSRDVKIITLTGCGGGRLSRIGSGPHIVVDSTDQQVSEDVQHTICHMLVRMLHYYNIGIIADKEFPDVAQLRGKGMYLRQREEEGKK